MVSLLSLAPSSTGRSARTVLTALALALTLSLLPGLSSTASAAHPGKASTRRDKPPGGPVYGQRSDVRELADQLATQHALPTAWVRQQLAQAHQIHNIPRLMQPPPSGQRKNWAAYRDRFIEPRRIEAGVAFWQEHRGRGSVWWRVQGGRRWCFSCWSSAPAAALDDLAAVPQARLQRERRRRR